MRPKELPEGSLPVYKGKIHTMWEWPQELYDGSVATFEAISRPDSVDVIAMVGDRFVLQYQEQPHRPGFLSLPGGRVDPTDPSLLEAAKRELREETGLVSENWSHWYTYRPLGKTFIWQAHVYVARACTERAQQQLDAGERVENKLITFDDLLDLDREESFRSIHLKLRFAQAKYDVEMKFEMERLFFGRR
jgi:8-oxo-dGTP pyrophosphatase MutT (NUDIX family)